MAKVDSRHPAARERTALAMTVGGRGGGFVYVIGDRFATRDLTAVMLHELGHVLGAGHDPHGHLMAPVYDRSNGHCIDRGAVAMVASAQRLPLSQLNWCVGPGLDDSRTSPLAGCIEVERCPRSTESIAGMGPATQRMA